MGARRPRRSSLHAVAIDALIARGSLRKIREQPGEVGPGVADEERFGRVPKRRLNHHQCDQLGVSELRRDHDRRSLGRALWLFDEEVVDRDLESRSEVSRSGFMRCVHSDQGLYRPPILDTFVNRKVDHRAERANPLELLGQ